MRGRKIKPAQVERARSLRRRMTDAETRLWLQLRDRRLGGFKFVRQLPVGRYYADFACREAMLIVEADGGQHAQDRDHLRDRSIETAGYTIIRFWNNDILANMPGVLQRIHDTLASIAPSPLRGEGQGEGSLVSVSDPSKE